MEFGLINISNKSFQKRTLERLIACNETTIQYGLSLNLEQAGKLVQTRDFALKENDRIELLGGVIDKIILAFCDSPYISNSNYEEVLHELIEMFYYTKNDTMDLISDDTLIEFMHQSFDGVCQGSLQLLAERELVSLSENLRFYGKIETAAAVENQQQNIENEDENDEY